MYQTVLCKTEYTNGLQGIDEKWVTLVPILNASSENSKNTRTMSRNATADWQTVYLVCIFINFCLLSCFMGIKCCKSSKPSNWCLVLKSLPHEWGQKSVSDAPIFQCIGGTLFLCDQRVNGQVYRFVIRLKCELPWDRLICRVITFYRCTAFYLNGPIRSWAKYNPWFHWSIRN